jgi:hypothetical protein
MTHLTEEDLILHYYGESADGDAAQAHLDGCPDCRSTFGSLARVLNAMDALPVPERAMDYEARVWQRLVGTGLRIPFWRRRFIQWPVAGLALASVLAAVMVIARPPAKPPVLQARSALLPPDQILRLTLGDYLDRSGIVLTELANAGDGRAVDISAEQKRAADLLTECRLYRQTAMRAQGEAMAQVAASVLDELERVLVEVAHTPPRLDPAEADELRDRLRSEGVLFRIRVLSSTVRNES